MCAELVAFTVFAIIVEKDNQTPLNPKPDCSVIFIIFTCMAHNTHGTPRPPVSPKFARVPQEGGQVQGGSRYVEGYGGSWFLGFSFAWFVGFLFVFGFLVPWLLGFNVSKFLGFEVSKFQKYI